MGDSGDTVDNFTNDSAMMIAWERSLETKREGALFEDPYAEVLAGSKGESLSQGFGAMCATFEFEDWGDFHRQWVACRTKFIDDHLRQLSSTGTFSQLVNLGAGMDTRPYRLECFKAFASGSFDVDMAVVQDGKRKIFSEILGSPMAHCPVKNISLDLKSEESTLSDALAKEGFCASVPSVILSEGLIMYLGSVGKLKLLRDLSSIAAPGSVLVLQFMDASESAAAKENPGVLDHALSQNEATQVLSEHGWTSLKFSRFGDSDLNFGRFPTDRFKPRASFSFCVCTKT